MSIGFANVVGVSDSRGVITQIADASGRVLWSAIKEIVTGTLILRPSADISVGHFLYPADSDIPAFQRINEEVSDGSALYITTYEVHGINSATSKFKLSNTTQFDGRITNITSVSIKGVPKLESGADIAGNRFKLEINGVETSSFTDESTKDIDISVTDASVIMAINEYLATHGSLPDINIIITSEQTASDKGVVESGVTQVYVVLGYEGY